MNTVNQQINDSDEDERRILSRIDAMLRINYQIITRQQSLLDPYHPSFTLPRYFLMLAELNQLDLLYKNHVADMARVNPMTAKAFEILAKKFDVMSGGVYDLLVDTVLPESTEVNISESGLSFITSEAIAAGTHLHITLSHPNNAYHVASTARVVYSRLVSEGKYRTGAYFVSIHPHDRKNIAASIAKAVERQSKSN